MTKKTVKKAAKKATKKTVKKACDTKCSCKKAAKKSVDTGKSKCPCCGNMVDRNKWKSQGIGLAIHQYVDKIIDDKDSHKRDKVTLREELSFAFIAGAEWRRLCENSER